MCRIEVKTYYHPDGSVEISERTIRCPDAPAMGLCAQVDRYEGESARLIEMRPSSSSSGRAGRKVELGRRPSKRQSSRQGSSSVQSPSPASNRDRNTARIPPPAPTPPPTGVEMPSPGDNTWKANTMYVKHVQPDDAATYRPHSRPHSGVFTMEEVVAERCGPSSIASTTVEQASILTTARHPSGLEIKTSRGSSGPSSPALSSPGLSSIQRLNIRHDSAQGSPTAGSLFNKARRPRTGSYNLASSRSVSSGSQERPRGDPAYRTVTPASRPSPERVPSRPSDEDILDAERQQMQSERAEKTARNRLSAAMTGNGSETSAANARRAIGETISPTTRRYSVVVHNPAPIGRSNSIRNSGEDFIAQQQARAEHRRSRDGTYHSSRRSDEAFREDSSEREETSTATKHHRRRRRYL